MTEHTEDKMCPKCSGVMAFRLGEFECQDCGYVELPGPTKEVLDERALNPFLEHSDGINRRKLIRPPDSLNVPTSASPPPVFRHNLEGCDDDESNRRYIASQALNAEKHTFMLVFFLVTAGMMILRVLLGGIVERMGSDLVSSIVLAAVYTVGLGVPLYYEWDLARKACIGFLGLQIVAIVVIVTIAGIANQFGSAWYFIPHVFLNCWLLWILIRDRRGEGDLTGGGCFWGSPINWR